MKLVKSISIFLVLALATLSLQAQSAADEKSLRDFINSGFDAYMKADVSNSAAFYAENATVIDWMGTVTTGREAIRASIEKGFQYEKPDPNKFHYNIASVRFIAPDVAVAQIDMSGVSTVEGKDQPWRGVDAFVAVRKNGKWLIELEQSTPIMQMPGN